MEVGWSTLSSWGSLLCCLDEKFAPRRRLFFLTPPPFPTQGAQSKQKSCFQGIRSALLGLIPSERSAQELFVQGRDKGQHQARSLHRLLGKNQQRKPGPDVTLAWMGPSWELGVHPDRRQEQHKVSLRALKKGERQKFCVNWN